MWNLKRVLRQHKSLAQQVVAFQPVPWHILLVLSTSVAKMNLRMLHQASDSLMMRVQLCGAVKGAGTW